MKIEEYDVFPNYTKARRALDFINSNPVFPIVGVNQKTGKPAPDCAKGEVWIREPIPLADENNLPTGEYAIPRIPDNKLDEYAINPASRAQYRANYGGQLRPTDQIIRYDPPDENV